MTLAFRYAARTDVGLIRDGNEDSGYAGPNLLAVADGMGGAVAGELASAITIETVRQYDSADLDDPVGELSDAASTANGRILARIKADPRLDGMGTTLTAGVLYDDNVLGVIHIGDSRAYLLRDGELKQLTHDHTFVQSLVDEGKLTPQQAEHHPHRSLIIRVLDGHHDVQLDVDRIELQAGDWLLFCSDGLGNADIRDAMIASAMIEAETPEAAALELIRKALRAGSPDNVTCVVAEVVDLEALGISPDRAAVFLGSQPLVVGAAAEPDLDIDQELDQDEVDGAAAAPAGPEAAAGAKTDASGAAASNGSAVAAATGAATAEIVDEDVDDVVDETGDKPADQAGDGTGDQVAADSGDETVDSPADGATDDAASAEAGSAGEDSPDADGAGQDGDAANQAADTAAGEADAAADAQAGETVDEAGDKSADDPADKAASDVADDSAGGEAEAAADASADRSDDESSEAAAGGAKRTSKGLRLVLAAMVLSIVGVLAVAGARFAFNWTQEQYYIGSYGTTAGPSDEHVAIFRGVNQKVPGIQLSSVLKVEQITLDQLPASHQRRVEETIPASDLDHAVQLVSDLQEIANGTGSKTSTTPVGDR